jgi:hypothetical protein
MFFTIDENNQISVFQNEETKPFLLQPYYPNGDSFDSKEEAETWAELFIESFTEGNLLAPEGKGLDQKPKPPVQPVKDGKVYIWNDETLSWSERNANQDNA